ncbi:MAG: hypothetical protein CMD81_16315 [Gammaproteobacteria bacterium]|nr:hypothetical protein [Gammaproteobacteria bacterium]
MATAYLPLNSIALETQSPIERRLADAFQNKAAQNQTSIAFDLMFEGLKAVTDNSRVEPPRLLEINHAVDQIKEMSKSVFECIDLINNDADHLDAEYEHAQTLIDQSKLHPAEKNELSQALAGVKQRFLDFKVEQLSKEAKSLYLKTMTIDQDAPLFHVHAANLWHRSDVTPPQKEAIEKNVIRFGLGQNMSKADRDRCIGAFFKGDAQAYTHTLEKWADRLLTEHHWNSDWPRRPLVGAWLEHATKCQYAPMSESLLQKLRTAINLDAPLIATKAETGFKGLTPGHQWGQLFPGDNKPAAFKVEKVESAQKGEKDVTKADALKLTFSFPADADKELPSLFTPGQHLAIMDLRHTSEEFKTELKQSYSDALDQDQFKDDVQQLSTEKFRYYTVESQQGGNDDGTLSIYLRVQKKDPTSNSMYLSGLKEGDVGLAGFPATDFTRCPKPQTPMLMFGQGTSASLENTFFKSRMLLNKDTNIQFAPSYSVMNYSKSAERFAAKELRATARVQQFNAKFRALVSHGDHVRPHIQKNEDNRFLSAVKTIAGTGFHKPKYTPGPTLPFRLLRDRNEFDIVKSLVLNPDAHIYFSGFLGTDKSIIENLKRAALTHNVPFDCIDDAVILAKQEGRFHVEGSVARNMSTNYQGT